MGGGSQIHGAKKEKEETRGGNDKGFRNFPGIAARFSAYLSSNPVPFLLSGVKEHDGV